jgi:hypothetical protein
MHREAEKKNFCKPADDEVLAYEKTRGRSLVLRYSLQQSGTSSENRTTGLNSMAPVVPCR